MMVHRENAPAHCETGMRSRDAAETLANTAGWEPVRH